MHILYSSLTHHLAAEEVALIKPHGSSGASHLQTDHPIHNLFYMLWLLYKIPNDDLTDRPAARQRHEMSTSKPMTLTFVLSQHQGTVRLLTLLHSHYRNTKINVTSKHINSTKHKHPLDLLLVSDNPVTKMEDGGLVMLKYNNLSIDVLRGLIYTKYNIEVLHQSNYVFIVCLTLCNYQVSENNFSYYLKVFFAH